MEKKICQRRKNEETFLSEVFETSEKLILLRRRLSSSETFEKDQFCGFVISSDSNCCGEEEEGEGNH